VIKEFFLSSKLEVVEMKDKIHPKYFTDAKVSCVCGHEFSVGSTQKEMRVDICSNCHPFYTGKQKLIDVEGRVERFKKRYGNYRKENADKA